MRTLLNSYKEKEEHKDYIRLEVRNITEITYRVLRLKIR